MLAALLYPAAYVMVYEATWMSWSVGGRFADVALMLAQPSPVGLLSVLVASDDARQDVLMSDGWAPDAFPGFELTPGLVAASLFVLLMMWCSFALVLRRLRDTRAGLWAFPFCLPAVWSWLVFVASGNPFFSIMCGATMLMVSIAPLSASRHPKLESDCCRKS